MYFEVYASNGTQIYRVGFKDAAGNPLWVTPQGNGFNVMVTPDRDLGNYQDIIISGRRFYNRTFNTGAPTAYPRKVYLDYRWPYQIDWIELESGYTLGDGDRIVAKIEYGVLAKDPNAEAAVEFVIESDLSWWKEIRVPDGEGSHWDIHTGAPGGWGARRFRDSIALWAHQVHNGQFLTFSKAKTLGFLSQTYSLGGLGQLPALSRVTFRWMRDNLPPPPE